VLVAIVRFSLGIMAVGHRGLPDVGGPELG